MHIPANNRAEISHKHSRAQERQMRRFKSPGQAQRFLAVHSQVHNLFRIGRHLLRAANYRLLRNRSYEMWRQVTCAFGRMVPVHQSGTIIMPLLTENQLTDIVDMIVDDYGSRLTGGEVSEVIGLILENISGFETVDSNTLTQTINEIRKRY
jgi:hypothetical protein